MTHYGTEQPNIPHQQQQPWTDPNSNPLPPATPPARKTSRKPLIAGAATLAVALLLFGAYAVWDRFVREDPGVAACKAIRDNDNSITGKQEGDQAGDKPKMTEQEYRQARDLFADSRNPKIREHGTALMDLAWQIDQLPKEEEFGALAFLGPLTTHAAGLQTACADEGIFIKMTS